MNILKSPLTLFVIATGYLPAQSVELIVLEREAAYLQTAPATINISPWEDTPFKFNASFDSTEGSFSNLQVTSSAGTTQLSQSDNGWRGEVGFLSLSAMNDTITSGTYTFSGTGNSVGAFSFPVQLTTPSLPAPKRITNFNELQNVDPTQPLTIHFEAFNDYNVNGVIDATVSYWTGTHSIDVWETQDERSDNIPGIVLTSTSITIPANSLKGALDNIYNISIYFASIDSLIEEGPTPFTSARVVTVSGVSIHANITTKISTPTWAGYPYATQDAWVNTGTLMGWINVAAAPFVWSSSLNKYIYLPELNVGASGGWAYVPK